MPADLHADQLSVVVVPVGGIPYLRRCLRVLSEQTAPAHEAAEQTTSGAADGAMLSEIVVPYDAREPLPEQLVAEFPHVRFLPVTGAVTGDRAGPASASYADRHAFYDLAKTQALDACQNLGMCAAAIVALVEDTVVPDPEWGQRVLAAHQQAFGAIGGAVEHAGEAALNWAVYLMDFGRFTLPRGKAAPSAHRASQLTDINVSYKAGLLNTHRDLWHPTYNEVEFHCGLMKRGEALWWSPDIVVHQDRGPLLLGQVIPERFQWGRIYGGKRAVTVSRSSLAALVVLSPAIPVVRLARLAAHLIRTGRHRLRFLVALPHLLLLTLAWSLGELSGYLGRPRHEVK